MKGDDDWMRRVQRTKRRYSLYVKQNKAYQVLLATLIIVFLIVTAVVVTSSGAIKPNSIWTDNLLIRMIIEKNTVRYQQNHN